MRACFNGFHRLVKNCGNQFHDRPPRQNEWGDGSGQRECERVESLCRFVFVLFVNLACAGFQGLMKDVVKMRVNQSRVVMVVVVAGMNVLERCQAKSLSQSQTHQQRGSATHDHQSNLLVTQILD